MWQGSGTGKSNSRLQRSRNRPHFHLKRTSGILHILNENQPLDPPFKIRLLVNDLSPTGVALFLDQRISPDQEVEVMIDDPINHTLKGTVVWCQEYIEAKHIISSEPYGFRVGIRFKFATTDDENEFKKICESLLGPLACKTRAA
jgi:hypothetical protein